jgi:hypothetical protein
MPDTDPVASTLSEIREHDERVIALCDMAPAVVRQLAEHDVPFLLAALEAALKEADKLSRKTVKGSPLERIRGECADRFRAAITAALTGKEAGE